jgi:hypothetical protein
VTSQQRMLTPPKAPDPTFAFVEAPCCPTLDFVIAFDYDYALHIVNFAILY